LTVAEQQASFQAGVDGQGRHRGDAAHRRQLLMRADLPHLEQAEARKWASLVRLLVRDMLATHRLGTVEVEEAARVAGAWAGCL
jgi:hypothetical protein